MSTIDLIIFISYFILLILIGFYFLGRNKDPEDYYLGGRNMGSMHIGLSVVATDVGGGFSIGLGGLGFVMGLSGSWLLFTGLIGAWVSGVVLIPKISKLSRAKKLFTFPEIFLHFYDKRVALAAGIISAIGYIGFTSSQILAGAKLASAAFPFLDLKMAILTMSFIIIVYTVLGGIKAVIYTDTIQWSLLILGLFIVGIPYTYHAVGGMDVVKVSVKPELLSLWNISWQQCVNWLVTIMPIWFVGMTLYQRIYASKSTRAAQRAWFIAGIFEWPVMAFMGVALGLLARVAADNQVFAQLGYQTASGMDPELGLPLLLVAVLPVGYLGIMMAAYFSAIMSTADSCLMAASGNITTDVFKSVTSSSNKKGNYLRISQIATMILGILALLIALYMENVLELMLYSYAFMVSGLFIPVLAVLVLKKPDPIAAFVSMIAGGGLTLGLIVSESALPLGLDANVFGISLAAIMFVLVYRIRKLT